MLGLSRLRNVIRQLPQMNNSGETSVHGLSGLSCGRLKAKAEEMNPVLQQITPEPAEQLVAQARAHGLSVDEYLKDILPDTNRHPEQLSSAEVDQILDELAEGSEHLPALPPNFSREDIYADHG